MSLICQCPAGASLTTIPAVTCPESFGQIQKVAFQRLRNNDGNPIGFDDSVVQLAEWKYAMAAADSSKVVVSPYIYSPADSGGDARMSSGGNDDLGGIPIVLGGEPVQFTGQLRAVPQATIEIMKALMCEAAAGNLGVYLFDEYGNIECREDGTENYRPIPIHGLYIGSKIHGNYDAKDSNVISWYYSDNYSDKLTIITPQFNPLTELVPPTTPTPLPEA